MIGDDKMKKHRLKKIADQELNFPVGMPFGEYNQLTPFDETRIDPKEKYTKKTFGPTNTIPWSFQELNNNSEWSLRQSSKKNNK